MKARILSLDSDAHQHAQSLLPWYVNGSLDAAQAGEVQSHLESCARCQADLAWQRKLRETPLDTVGGGDVERDFAALRLRAPARRDPADSAPFVRPRRWTQALAFTVGAPAVFIAGLALGVFGTLRPAEPYAVLGSGGAAPQANALIVFRADATEAQIRAALQAGDAQLVGGPTVTDAYLVRLADMKPERLAILRGQPAVLRAESIVSERRR